VFSLRIIWKKRYNKILRKLCTLIIIVSSGKVVATSFVGSRKLYCCMYTNITIIQSQKTKVLRKRSLRGEIFETKWTVPQLLILIIFNRYFFIYNLLIFIYITPPTSFQLYHCLKWRHVTAQYFTILGQLQKILGK